MYNAAVELLEPNLRVRPGKIAFIDDADSYTYAELAERVDRCANALRALGVRPGQRVLLGLLDSIAFPTVFLGAIKAGIVAVPVNTMLRAADFAYVLEHSEAVAAIVSSELWPAFADAIATNGWRGRAVIAGKRETGLPFLDDLLAAAKPSFAAAPTEAGDACFWLYSSGSTGKPKGTVHRHASLMQTADSFASKVLDLRESDVVYSAAKLFFAYGLGNALTFPMAAGATSVLVAGRPTPELVAETLAKHRVTLFCGVPTLYNSLLASDAFRAAGGFALRLCTSAGESLPRHVGETWREVTGVDIIDGIGSTEMLHIFLSTRPGGVTYGVTGVPVPGYSVRLVDEHGVDVADGELGELLVSGPSAFSMYWGDPEKTRRTIEGAWVRTGDKFSRDADGNYVHRGRTDDMIKAGGIWVSPMEVESALASHEAVLEVAVIGVADSADLYKPKAFVVLRPGFAPSEALESELKAYVKDRLAPYKFPRWIEFIDELPKTATGKTQRHLLRGREAERNVAPA